MSADRAGIFESMVKVPIPDQDGQEVTCMLDYSIWPGSEKWREDTPRPYQNVVQELFSCPLREACTDLGMEVERERERERETESARARERETETETETDRQTD